MRYSYIFFAIISLCFSLSICNAYPAEEDGYIKSKCVIHVHSTVSSGYLSIEDYSRLAKEKGIDAVVITDNALDRYEYGLWPFRRILKKVVEKGSILRYGANNYLGLIEKANKVNKDVIIIDGAQLNPFYFWTGSVFRGNLTLNNRNKDMLVIGLSDSKAYEHLPLVGNRRAGFDQYHGEKYTGPYQDLIDYVNQRGSLIFWSHPEIEENILVSGVRLITIPYSYELLGTEGYTGFGIFAEGYNTIGRPQGLWDRLLTEYCVGKRKNPIWAIGELEYGGEENKDLDDAINMLYVKRINREGVSEALKSGRFYVATKASPKIHLTLDEFFVSDELTGRTAVMGETLASTSIPVVRIKLSHEKFINEGISVKLIKNNQVIKEYNGIGSVEVEFKDEFVRPDELVYYRLDVISESSSRLISNPIFFKRR